MRTSLNHYKKMKAVPSRMFLKQLAAKLKLVLLVISGNVFEKSIQQDNIRAVRRDILSPNDFK